MAWLRIDDGMPEHHKILSLPRKDRWTWIELLCYVARQNNGGHVPQGVCDLLRWVTPAFVKRCVELELLDREDDGYHVHDWDVYNPPRVDADDLDERVAETLERFPDASANEVARILGGRKKDVLDAVRRFRAGTIPVPKAVPGNQSGTGGEPVTRAGARARPVPVLGPHTPSPNPFPTPGTTPDDDEDLNQALHGIKLAGPARTTALELLATDPARLHACVTASLTASKPAAYLAELIRNGSHPEPPRPEPHAPDPTRVCPDCGQKLGHGHLETCPRMPTQADEDPEPSAPRTIEPPPSELLAAVGLAAEPDADPEPELDPEPRVGGAA